MIKKEDIYEGLQNFDYEESLKPKDIMSIGWIGHEIYTGGLKINNHVGAAYVHYYNGTEINSYLIRLGNQNTVFMAEVIAFAQGPIWSNRSNRLKAGPAKTFSKRLNSIDYMVITSHYNQMLKSHGVFGAHQAELFDKEGGCPSGEQLETVEYIVKFGEKKETIGQKAGFKKYL
ncbi:hypothetical protein AVEN_28928-1 [Araneus ventricosus]|uniref:Uncharacterized protein n=1 Tax=Araneus ventricosus TaxID=182803 RepID=A0A4Y2AJ48_ARAVE|nr:hypothetical protein AVEN_28928-1 [Araneus ventricosus]